MKNLNRRSVLKLSVLAGVSATFRRVIGAKFMADEEVSEFHVDWDIADIVGTIIDSAREKEDEATTILKVKRILESASESLMTCKSLNGGIEEHCLGVIRSLLLELENGTRQWWHCVGMILDTAHSYFVKKRILSALGRKTA